MEIKYLTVTARNGNLNTHKYSTNILINVQQYSFRLAASLAYLQECLLFCDIFLL